MNTRVYQDWLDRSAPVVQFATEKELATPEGKVVLRLIGAKEALKTEIQKLLHEENDSDVIDAAGDRLNGIARLARIGISELQKFEVSRDFWSMERLQKIQDEFDEKFDTLDLLTFQHSLNWTMLLLDRWPQAGDIAEDMRIFVAVHFELRRRIEQLSNENSHPRSQD